MTITVFELRNYEMRPGRRDALIDLFDANFLESQEALGASVIGTFRDLDDPNRFVWMRGFESMECRFAALDGFYTSAVWHENRTAANATMVDSDNVLLLRSVDAEALTQPTSLTPAATSAAVIVARTYHLPHRGEEAFISSFRGEALPRLAKLRATPVATFTTEHAPNSFPRLPVREGETVFVSLTRFADADAYARQQAALIALDRDILNVAPEIMRLSPTPRSRLR